MASEFCCSNPGTAVSAVILDLDGTLLDTESATNGIVGEFLAKFGKELDKEREGRKRLGMTLEVTAASIVRDYDLPLTPDQFVAEIMPMYQEKWSRARAMPGADRLIKHLYKHGVPFALASNSLREYIDEKIAHHEGWKDYFSVILGRDQVKSGKPAPDLFLEAARKMGVDAAECVVIEDSLVGVKAAKAAKMSVVAVPSPSETDCSLFADSVLSSLLEFQPEQWCLPPFDELENGESPIEPVHKSIQLEENGSIEEIFGKCPFLRVSVHQTSIEASSFTPRLAQSMDYHWYFALLPNLGTIKLCFSEIIVQEMAPADILIPDAWKDRKSVAECLWSSKC